MPQPQFDLVLFGATSFVGQITARYLAQRVALEPTIRWAIAGRSLDKVKALADSLTAEGYKAPIPQLVVDSRDASAMRTLAEQTKVVATSVGPYALYGEQLVKACAEAGTDYCDLTGEVQWIAQMIERYSDVAQKSGARIVHCCGFDSIPSDVGVYVLQQAAKSKFGQPVREVRLRVKRMRGGFSGGTIASLLNLAKETSVDPTLFKRLADPYLLCPSSEARPRQHIHRSVTKEDGRFLAPFVMAQVNEKIVHRSNALTNFAYGRDFKYDEAVDCGADLNGRLRATAQTVGFGSFMALIRQSWSLEVLSRWVLPKPGQGPSEEAQRKGHFTIRMDGDVPGGQNLSLEIRGDRDPGYGSTGKMFAESAFGLVETHNTKERIGFLTPSVAMGDRLVERLKNAGVTFKVVEA